MNTNQTFQKVLALIILVLIPIFIVKEYKAITSKANTYHTQSSGPIIPNEYAKTENKSFVICIFSLENSPPSEKTLRSIFEQSYTNFRVVYLIQSPSDTYLKEAEELASQLGYSNRIIFKKSRSDEQLFQSFYQTIHSCKDEEVIIHLDNNDWFANSNVLATLNQAYKDPDVWLLYGDSLEYPSLKQQGLSPVINSALREFKASKSPWMLSHLKTYYAGLLKQVTPSSEGLEKKALTKDDKMLMLSLLKIGKWHVRFIPDVLYVHNGKS